VANGIKGIENIKKYFEELGLIDNDIPELNAQILNHAPGTNGLDIKNNIMEEGLYISSDAKRAKGISEHGRQEVSEGICSTNSIINKKDTNEFFYEFMPCETSKSDVHMSVVTAIPQEIDGIWLGKIRQGTENQHGNACLLDECGIDKIPPEFILGIYYYNSKHNNVAFEPNEKFYALNEKNYENAANFIKSVLKKDELTYEFVNAETREDSKFYKRIFDSLDKSASPNDVERYNHIKNAHPFLSELFKKVENDIMSEKMLNDGKDNNLMI